MLRERQGEDNMEYNVHGSKNQNDSNLLWSEFVETNE